ncbi:hypothetical protein Esi_0701_0001 [Ectocarpus siliculosus]|uniref:Uncharacterized protein n=1 Tax=Ectocarpus siliculosus TaxID=2880 RepID=D7G5Z9_ECTSI|nr:hypothetical protein Esi_0701_0001 [Ectocarpus siliculosus]|eukprot:CBJ33919.1 hypothetical protein Esi_0701_0001 [Ectocarpus siliculosus]
MMEQDNEFHVFLPGQVKASTCCVFCLYCNRCAALVALNAAKDSGQEICPLVDVHSAVDADTERLIAATGSRLES